jgi:hypothetical protein
VKSLIIHKTYNSRSFSATLNLYFRVVTEMPRREMKHVQDEAICCSEMLTSRSVHTHCYSSFVGNKIQRSLIWRHTYGGGVYVTVMCNEISFQTYTLFEIKECSNQWGKQLVNNAFGNYNEKHFSFLVISYNCLNLVTYVTIRTSRYQIIYKNSLCLEDA